MRWTREQYIGLMTYGEFPRPMFVEPFGPLKMLADEWLDQGVPEDQVDLTAFDFDYVQTVGCGGNCRAMNLPQPVVIEQTPTHVKQRNGFGCVTLLDKRTATIPLPLEFPVAGMDDWLKIKHHFAWSPQRIDQAMVQQAVDHQKQGCLVRAGIPGAYSTLRNLMGEEALTYAGYDQPELLHDILGTLGDTAMRTLDPVSRQVTIDQLSVHEDMAGKSGPLWGPQQVTQFMEPYFRPIWEMLADRGAVIFDIDTDGNVNAIMEQLHACGLNHLHPMEPAAGMDIVACRARYGRKWSYLGGLDKFAVMQGPDAIDAELDRKLTPELMQQGGIAFGLDHRIPNGTSIEHYRYYVHAARERLGLPPADGTRRGWQRMAM